MQHTSKEWVKVWHDPVLESRQANMSHRHKRPEDNGEVSDLSLLQTTCQRREQTRIAPFGGLPWIMCSSNDLHLQMK